MLLPHELAARYVVPYLRALVAQKLSQRGYGQDRIARLLGVTQAMVSKYLSWGERYVKKRLQEAGVDPEEAYPLVSIAAERLALGDKQGYLELLTSFVNSLLSRGLLCRLHRRHGAPENCNICSRLFVAVWDNVLSELRLAIERFIQQAPPEIVPNVGSNIVYARPGASSLEEVAGLTGAVMRLSDGRLVAVGEPAYGGSRHTSRVLLLAMRRCPGIRAAAVVAYREECIEVLKKQGEVVRVGPHCCPERLLEDISKALEMAPCNIVGVASLGGYNLEPVIYVFGRNPIEVVERILQCRQAS